MRNPVICDPDELDYDDPDINCKFFNECRENLYKANSVAIDKGAAMSCKKCLMFGKCRVKGSELQSHSSNRDFREELPVGIRIVHYNIKKSK